LTLYDAEFAVEHCAFGVRSHLAILGTTMTYPEDFDDLLIYAKEEFLLLTARVQTAFCIHRFEAELNNGGFHQFFSNSTGEYVRETAQALKNIGADSTTELLARAVAVGFPGGYPEAPRNYEEMLADFDDVADELLQFDQEFYQYSDPLADMVNAYLEKTS